MPPLEGEPAVLIDIAPEEITAFVFLIALGVPVVAAAASVPVSLLGEAWSSAFVRAVVAHGIVNAALLVIAYILGGLYLTLLVAHTAIAAVVSLIPAVRSASHMVIVPGAGIVLISLVVDAIGGDPLIRFYWLAPFFFSVLIWVVLTWQAGRTRSETEMGVALDDFSQT